MSTYLTETISESEFGTTGVSAATYDLNNKKFGASSIVFDSTATSTWLGAGNPIRLNAPANTSLYGLTNFTISFWINPTEDSNGTEVYIDQHRADGWCSWYLRKYNGNVWFVAGDNAFLYTSAGYLNQNNWNHVAVVKQSTVYKLFVNGVTRATTSPGAITYSQSLGYLSIGGGKDHGGTFHNFDGRIDEFWITNTAEWSTDFSVPTSPRTTYGAETLFLMHFDQPQYKIQGTTTEDCKVIVFDEATWALEASEDVSEGSYDISVSQGTKTIMAVPDDTNINGKVYRGVETVTI